MKARKAWKKALAAVLTGTMLVGSLSTISAASQGTVDDIVANGWWESFTESIELYDGTTTTITFTGTTYADAEWNWDTPTVFAYTRGNYFYGGNGGDLEGYSDYDLYFAMRSDCYGWDDVGNTAIVEETGEDTLADGTTFSTTYPTSDWADWLTASKAGIQGKIVATLDGDTLTFEYTYGEAVSIVTCQVNTSMPVYISLTGEMCTVTDISYERTALHEYDSVTDVEIPTLRLSDEFSLYGQTATLSFTDGTSADVSLRLPGINVLCKGYYVSYEILDDDSNSYEGTIYDSGDYTLKLYIDDMDGNRIGTYSCTLTVFDIVASDLGATELTLSSSKPVTLTEDASNQWFYYTCTEENEYLFVSADNSYTGSDGSTYSCDPYASLFKLNEDGTLSYLTSNDDGGSSVNFELRYNMESGTTYYLKAELWGSEKTDASYTVSVVQAKRIKSISIDSLSVTTFTQFEDWLYEEGTVLTITYEDNTTAQVTSYSTYAVDDYCNYIYFYLVNGEDKMYSGNYVNINSGEYTICFYTDDTSDGERVSATSTVTVVAPDSIELLDTEYTTTIAADKGFTCYSYTPAVSGQYYFVSSLTTTSTDYSDYVPYSLMYNDSNGDVQYLYPDYDETTDNNVYDPVEGKYYVYTLTAGTTYYYRYDYYDDSSAKADATLTVTAKQIGHTHTYADKVVTFTWADDYTATATLRCDTCSETVALDVTVTKVETAATETTDGSIVYTATATYNGETYGTDSKTVVIPATGTSTETPATTETPSETPSESTETPTESEDTEDVDTEDTEDEDTEDVDTEDTEDEDTKDTEDEDAEDGEEDSDEDDSDTTADTDSESPKTGDANLPLFVLIAAMGCAVVTVASKKRFVK